jgi:dihydrofolate reductase
MTEEDAMSTGARDGSRTGQAIWHLTMSLDGFMADQDGSLEWMPTDAGPVPMGFGLVPDIGAILAGRRTYDAGISSRPPGGGQHGRANSTCCSSTSRPCCSAPAPRRSCRARTRRARSTCSNDQDHTR